MSDFGLHLPYKPVPGRPLQVGVLASGRGSNLQAIIDAIEAGQMPARIALVVTDRPDAQALERARRHGIEALFLDPAQFPTRTAHQAELAGLLRERGVHLVALAGFMRILRQPMLAAFPGRIMNIHPSLLPAFPGLEAQRQAIEYGVKVSGCTVHFVDAGTDTGPVIMQAAVPVEEGDTPESLAGRILAVEHRLYPEAIGLFAAGRLALEGRRVRVLPAPERREGRA